MCPNQSMLQDQPHLVAGLLNLLNEENVEGTGLFVQGKGTIAEIIKQKGPGYAYHWLACRDIENLDIGTEDEHARVTAKGTPFKPTGAKVNEGVSGGSLMHLAGESPKGEDPLTYEGRQTARSASTESWDVAGGQLTVASLSGKVVEVQTPSARKVVLRVDVKTSFWSGEGLVELSNDLVRRTIAANEELGHQTRGHVGRRVQASLFVGKSLTITNGPSARIPYDRSRRTRLYSVPDDATITVGK